jgi:hypothetical protein
MARSTRFGAGLTNAQMQLARRFEAAGLTTISQAVKAFERRDDERIESWKKELAKIDESNGRAWSK